MKALWSPCLQAGVFLFEVEVAAVRAEENVAGQALEHLRTAVLIVVGDLRIGLVADQFVAGDDVGAADDDDVEGLAGFGSRPWSRWWCPWCGRR